MHERGETVAAGVGAIYEPPGVSLWDGDPRGFRLACRMRPSSGEAPRCRKLKKVVGANWGPIRWDSPFNPEAAWDWDAELRFRRAYIATESGRMFRSIKCPRVGGSVVAFGGRRREEVA
jgi:hypothetical protein